jgi:Tfp pilus assembly protein PilF
MLSIGFPKVQSFGLLGLLVVGCSGIVTAESQPTVAQPRNDKPQQSTTPPVTKSLSSALTELASARYAIAEASLRHLIAQDPSARARAEVALAELWLMTGKREQAAAIALPHCQVKSAVQFDGCLIVAESLRRQGDLEHAIDRLRPFKNDPTARRLNLLLADLLAEKGLSSEARLLYKRLVSDYNDSRFSKADAPQLAITGRAAHRLGSFHDANELFNEAERNGVSNVETLLWRGELYLDAHDPKHARAIADEALSYAPDHPGALLLFAKVRLAESRDAETAEHSATRVLELDATNANAYYVLAGLRLRDLNFADAHRFVDLGLVQEPRHLELLSLRAAAYFLADETEPFQQAVASVLKQNPDYSRLFRLVAEYAEAEHRYTDTIPLLRRASALDPNDAQVHAQLGIQLVRSGEESEGRRELIRAFAQDPFDLRVRNTLVLYERQIDHDYTSYSRPPFEIRVPQAYKEALEQVISPLVDTAYKDLSRRYGKLENSPIRLELYSDQDSFGVRTSGVPASFLQGVCFGNTVVARLPLDEPVNVGMTLWHELSHVFHLQLSKHRVPRWFTEGLAEVETKRRRPEWSREQELNVYEAFVAGKIPNILDMNAAFSHATSLNDLAVAYVSATYLVEYLVEHFGFVAMPKLLVAWSQGTPTAKVLANVLKVSVENLNQGFTESLKRRFARFEGQYLPPNKTTPISVAKAELARNSDDPRCIAVLAQALLLAGQIENSRSTLRRVTVKNQHHPDVLWVNSLLALTESNPHVAMKPLDELLHAGFDGYFVRLQRALALRLEGRFDAERDELIKAHQYHPTASDPLYRLITLAQTNHDLSSESKYVTALCKLEESDVRLHRRHVELRLALGQTDLAWTAAEALAYVDLLDSESHLLIAKAALAKHDRIRAKRERALASILASTPADQQRLNGLTVDP